MKISVITPSFNQAPFLPANLSSVGSQTHPNVEHILVDPGSTDGSREIAASALNIVLIAEPDRGQSDGITKGFARSTGDIITWLNSDDLYPSDSVLEIVAREFQSNPDVDVIYGKVNFVDENGEFLRKGYVNPDDATLLESFQYQVGIVQPGLFMRRSVFEALGGPSEQYEYCMDYEYWVRIATAGFKWKYVDEVLAHHRWWDGMKTSKGRDASLVEHMRVCEHYFGYIHWKWIDRYAEYLTSSKDGVVNHSTQTDAKLKATNLTSVINRFVSQDMLNKISNTESPQRHETWDFIRQHAPTLQRYYAPAEEISELAETHSAPNANMRSAWYLFDGTAPNGQRYKTYKVPNNFHRAFTADWYEQTISAGIQKLKKLSLQKKSDVCVVVANGPSLNKTDLALLEGVDVIISNFATLNENLLKSATLVTVTNTLVAEQGSVSFNNIRTPKILPVWLSHRLNHTEETCFVAATVRPDFCTSFDDEFSWRSTVSYFNMQIAFALGFKKVILVGFDHYYSQPENAKEGDPIDQQEDDQNHFDPRYFKGKVWQAADTGNMEKVYELARVAFEADGREIVNCTVGGHLEVFRRGHLADELPSCQPQKLPHPDQPSPESRLPRILVFDITPIGNGTATGEIKKNIFDGWPPERYLQIYNAGRGSLGVLSPDKEEDFISTPGDLSSVESAIREFNPELILYRPVPDSQMLHASAMHTLCAYPNVPLVTWIMDDWLASLQKEDPDQFAALDADWRALVERSSLRLSICKKMSEAMEARYGAPFHPFANGVDPADWPARTPGNSETFTIRYAGGLADNMTAQSILRVAQAVEQLANVGHKVKFEIRTRPVWLEKQAHSYAALAHTSFLTDLLPSAEYREWLRNADAVVIGYNFDPDSLSYIGSSMANKMPECLASGAPLLAHGPLEAATIAYLKEMACAIIVDIPQVNAVNKAILELMSQPETAHAMSAKARVVAFERHNIHKLKAEFASSFTEAASKPVVSNLSLPIASKHTANKSAQSANQNTPPVKMPTNSTAIISTLAPEKAAESTTYAINSENQNGKSSMLQKTPPNALSPPQAPIWYAGPAQKLQAAAPPLFGALRFMRRSFVHVISRPHLIAALLGATALTAWVGLDPQFDAQRPWIFTFAGLGALGAAVAYVAAKAQAHIATMHIQNQTARAEIAQLQHRLQQVDQQVTLRDNSAIASVRNQIAEAQSALALNKAATAKIATDLAGKASELDRKVSGLTEISNAALATLQAEATRLQAALNLAQAELKEGYKASASVNAKLSELEAALNIARTKSDEDHQALTGKLDDLGKRLEASQSADSALKSQVETLISERAKIDGALETRLSATEKWAQFDNAAWFQHFNRKLSRQHIDTLDKEWRKRLSIPMQPATLGYMANRACEIERRLEGRLATSIEDILLRSLVARAVKGKSVDVLEIGTLFGTGAAIMFDALEGHYEQIHFTLLDPLEGYYNGAQADILTGQRVNEHVVRKNFSRVGMSEDQYTLVKHLSTEPEAMQKAAARKYDVLVIDGDHSYAGVKTDFENYAPLVRVGGYIILDDYNSPDWPDVKEYVDKELDKHEFVAPVGATWRTSVYRVVKDVSKGARLSGSTNRKKPAARPETDESHDD